VPSWIIPHQHHCYKWRSSESSGPVDPRLMSAAERALAQRGGTNSSSSERHITNTMSLRQFHAASRSHSYRSQRMRAAFSRVSPPPFFPSLPHRSLHPHIASLVTFSMLHQTGPALVKNRHRTRPRAPGSRTRGRCAGPPFCCSCRKLSVTMQQGDRASRVMELRLCDNVNNSGMQKTPHFAVLRSSKIGLWLKLRFEVTPV